ncbi:MAG: GNAT family N-acetyltransferase [Candidatus Eisenbacteria bacterium]|nr:GNAT family N-acetyltransferase [Candidatus Eisenbacteria bacterium]
MQETSNPDPFRRAADVWRTRGTRELLRRLTARLASAVFKSNCAVWYGKDLSTEVSRAGRAGGDGEETGPAESGAASVESGTTPAESRPGVQSVVPGEVTAGDFAVADPLELGGWLRESAGLAWAADDRELEVAVSCGHKWTLWRLDGETVAFCKVGGGSVFIVDFDRAFDLPVGLIYLSDVYVMSRMRGKGIGRALLAATMRFLADNSFTGVVCHIPRKNVASAGLFGSLGFVRLGEVRFVRVFGMPFYSTRPERLLEELSSRRS